MFPSISSPLELWQVFPIYVREAHCYHMGRLYYLFIELLLLYSPSSLQRLSWNCSSTDYVHHSANEAEKVPKATSQEKIGFYVKITLTGNPNVGKKHARSPKWIYKRVKMIAPEAVTITAHFSPLHLENKYLEMFSKNHLRDKVLQENCSVFWLA